MKNFTLAEIAKACNGEYVGDESLKNTKITSVERDSRQVKNGSLFLAIKGERVDGLDFIEKCFMNSINNFSFDITLKSRNIYI